MAESSDFGQALDVRLHVGDDHGIGRRIPQDDAVLGDQRGEEPLDLLRVRVLQGNELSDDLVLGVGLFELEQGLDVLGARLGGRDDFHDLAGFHRGEPVHLQHGLEHLVGFVQRDARRRDDGDLAFDGVVDHEVRSRQFAHELDEQADVDVVEVDRDELLARFDIRCAGCRRLGRRAAHPQQGSQRQGGPCRHVSVLVGLRVHIHSRCGMAAVNRSCTQASPRAPGA